MTDTTALLWRGILAIVIGVVAVAWPGITVGAFVLLFAVYAFLAAGMEAVRAFRSSAAGPVVGRLLLALLDVVAGVVALAWPGITALALVLWVAVWALATGGVEIALAFRAGRAAGQRALLGLSGLVSIALGVVLVIRPDVGAVSLAEVYGLFSLVSGISFLVTAANLHSAGLVTRDARSSMA
jgi:uncharacterized membrane protein HdeD (DUF308 family)